MSFALFNIAISQGPGESPVGTLLRQASNAVGLTESSLAAILSVYPEPGSDTVAFAARFAGVEGETPVTFATRLGGLLRRQA